MAKYEIHKPTLNGTDYPTQISNFIDAAGTDMDTYDTESYATVISPITGNLAEMNALGDLVDSGLATTSVPQTSGALVNGQYLMADASGNIVDSGVSKLGTVSQFESANIPMTISTSPSAAHGMNTKPRAISLWLECITTEHGYSVGDQVLIASTGLALMVDGTNYTLIIPSVLPVYDNIPAKASPHAAQTITPAKWEYVITGVKND